MKLKNLTKDELNDICAKHASTLTITYKDKKSNTISKIVEYLKQISMTEEDFLALDESVESVAKVITKVKSNVKPTNVFCDKCQAEMLCTDIINKDYHCNVCGSNKTIML